MRHETPTAKTIEEAKSHAHFGALLQCTKPMLAARIAELEAQLLISAAAKKPIFHREYGKSYVFVDMDRAPHALRSKIEDYINVCEGTQIAVFEDQREADRDYCSYGTWQDVVEVTGRPYLVTYDYDRSSGVCITGIAAGRRVK